MEQEAWLSGKINGVLLILMPAAHALVHARRDVEKATANVSVEELWTKPNGAPSVGFHLKHVAGSVDRLLTYAHGENLTDRQFAFLNSETATDDSSDAEILVREAVEAIESAISEIKLTPEEILFEERFVGRQKLPTNAFGLLFHIAEHTQRHVGQIVTTAKIVRRK